MLAKLLVALAICSSVLSASIPEMEKRSGALGGFQLEGLDTKSYDAVNLKDGSWEYANGTYGGPISFVPDLSTISEDVGYLIGEEDAQPTGLIDIMPYSSTDELTKRTFGLDERGVCCTVSVCGRELLKICLE